MIDKTKECPLYWKFKEGQEVRIKKNLTYPNPLVDDFDIKIFKRYEGIKTIIRNKYNHCCSVEIDKGEFGWAYEWLESIDNDLPNEWFDI